MDREQLHELLATHGIRPNLKHLHQYFIIDPDTLSTIVEAANLQQKDRVMEIGAGVGNITELLARKAYSVEAFEIDRRLKPILNALERRYPNITLRFDDVKRAKWQHFNCVVANIPFNILEPIFSRLVRVKFRNAILVVGERFRNAVIGEMAPQTMTKFGAMVRAFFMVEEIATVAQDKFYPSPGTDATIVRLTPGHPHNTFLILCRTFIMNPETMVAHAVQQVSFHGQIKKSIERLPALRKRADRLTNQDFRELLLCCER